MKTHHRRKSRGFTLIELMVAMGITTIIVTVLLSITSIALDAWNRSRAEIRAARQAKAMVEMLARDFEAMVARRGNNFEWLIAETGSSVGGAGIQSSNSADLIFFTAATDRYNGAIGTVGDLGGDVSTVSYALRFKDPIASGTSGASGTFPTFVLYRKLVNPDETFRNLLGQTNLKSAFSSYSSSVDDMPNFVCENIFQFTLTFHVEVSTTTGGTTTTSLVPVTLGTGAASSVRLRGNGLEVTGGTQNVAGGRIVAVEVSLSVLTDSAMESVRNRPNPRQDFVSRNSYQYSKRIEVPSL